MNYFDILLARKLKGGGGEGYNLKTASGDIVTIRNGVALPMPSLTVGIEAVQAGTGDPSPTNVRPISGWSAVNVYDTDINAISVFDDWLTSINVGHSISKDTITIDYLTLTPYNNPCTLFDTDRTVTISVDEITGQATGVKIQLLDVNNTFVGQVTNSSKTFTGVGSKIRIDYGGGGLATFEGLKIYAQGTTYTTTLKDGQGNPMTCYGGTLTNENGVQRLDNGYGYAELSEDWNWQKSSTYHGSFYVDVSATLGYKTYTPIMCSHAKTINNIANYVYGGCLCEGSLNFWLMSAEASVQDWKDYIVAQRTNGKPIGIKFELATPQQIPQDNLSIATQEGTNNLWADSGDIIECKYFEQA